MEDIIDNHVICAIYRLPDAHGHITRPPHGVGFPKKTVAIEDLKPEPVLWHEDSGETLRDLILRNCHNCHCCIFDLEKASKQGYSTTKASLRVE
ncbi:5'-3' exoribonuclease, partial [Trifolium medium]|nr:5'-3' exoribonuclease [Trifolium medium]